MPYTSRSAARLLIALAITVGLSALVASNTIGFLVSSTSAAEKDKDARIFDTRLKQELPRHLLAARERASNIIASSYAASPPLPTETKLIAGDGAPGNNLGFAVAISNNTAVVGDNNSVYVFARSNGTWAQQQKLSTGGSKKIAIDGETIVAAGGNQFNVFVRNGATWTPQQLITIDGSAPVSSVAISGDTIVIGTADDTEGCATTSFGGRGAAFVFVRSGALWTQQQKLIASDGQCGYQGSPGFAASLVASYIHFGDRFGHSVSISGDTILVGAYTSNTGSNTNAGAAYVFGRSSGTWTQQQKLLASNISSNDYFGFSVAINVDTAVIGAIGSTGALAAPDQPGSAYVFGRSNGTWTQQQEFAAGVAPNCFYNFGGSVAVSGDEVVVGCNSDIPPPGPFSPPSPLGSAYLYKRSGSMWVQQSKLIAADGVQGDNFGNAVAISGPTVVVGAYRDDTPNGLDAGSAYVFDSSDVDTTPPSLTLPASIKTEATSSAGAVVNYSVAATDNVDTNPTIDCAPASGSVFPIGTTLVNCTATDASNNTASDNFTVNVDNPPPPPPPPTIPNCPPSPAPASSGNLRRSVALGPLTKPDAVGGEQDLLFRYNPCAPDPKSNIEILKKSGTTWVRLWVYWPAFQPESTIDLINPTLPDGSPNLSYVGNNDRTKRFFENLNEQIRVAQREGFKVILTTTGFPTWANNYNPLNPAHQPDPSKPNDANSRRPEHLVPTDLSRTSAWGKWVDFLVKQYGFTKEKKIDLSNVDPLNGRYIDFLELCNEPNLDSVMWPQRSFSRPDVIVMPRRVAQMFQTAQAIVEARNRLLQNSSFTGGRMLNRRATTLYLTGPATSDSEITNDRRTSYHKFTEELLKALHDLDPNKFNAKSYFAWSHHNYKDVEEERNDKPCKPKDDKKDNKCRDDYTKVNSAAWVRSTIVNGIAIGKKTYRWTGWLDGESKPSIILTEGGARLHVISKNGSFPDIDRLKKEQARLVKDSFTLMRSGALSAGIGMFNNYLIYTDPCYDTGLFDFLQACDPNWDHRARGCNPAVPNFCTGGGGAPRYLYGTWQRLPSAR